MNRTDCPDPVTLRDGGEVCVVPLEEGDVATVAAVFDALGERSRRERFHGPRPVLRESELAATAAVDHREREALVALELESERPVALFELVRERPGSARGEVAFAVADDWQGRGLGGTLVRRLATRARQLCFERLRANVVASNERALALVRRLGSVVEARVDGSGYELEVVLDREE